MLCVNHTSMRLSSFLLLNLARTVSTLSTDPRVVRYFAYGSNMDSKVLTGRRRIKPLTRTPAFCRGNRLAFTALGIPPFEPCFASLDPGSIDDECHGVLYEIASSDWNRLCASEGVPFAYQVREVKVQPYRNGPEGRKETATTIALTLQAVQLQVSFGLPRIDFMRPSRRYLDIIRNGARENGLDETWIAKLDAL